MADDGDPAPTLLNPASALIGVVGADAADGDSVDGTPAPHYSFDENALGEAGRATSRGELWVATTGGYIVRYMATTTAKADDLGDGIEGTTTFAYTLSGVEQPTGIAVPAEWPPGL